MGLDAFLTAEIYFCGHASKGDYTKKTEGYDAGYWRKRHALHEHIRNVYGDEYADGSHIALPDRAMEELLELANEGVDLYEDDLTPEDKAEFQKEDTEIFTNAIAWLKEQKEGQWRSFIYTA